MYAKNLRNLFFTLLFTGMIAFEVLAQSSQPTDPIVRLLQATVPAEVTPPGGKDKTAMASTPPAAPADDAPIEELARYWMNPHVLLGSWSSTPPSAKVRERLLDYLEKDLDSFPMLAPNLPDTPTAHDRVKRWFDQRSAKSSDPTDNGEKYWQTTVKDWLMLRSRHFRDELISHSEKLIEGSGMIQNDKYLRALSSLDWERAQPLLLKHLSAESQRKSTLALSILYLQAVERGDTGGEREWRTRLLTITADKKATGYARATAIEALMKNEWGGREEWYLSLFSDESLKSLADGIYPLKPLESAITTNRERLLPLIISLIGNSNRTVHDNAVKVLLDFNRFGTPRPETLSPLLPWLLDSNWTSLDKFKREEFLRVLQRVTLPESVPGLISIIEKEPRHDSMWAAEALSQYQAPQAGPALRKAADKSVGMTLYPFINAIVRCDVLTDEERISALIKYASHIKYVNPSAGLDYQPVGGDFDDVEWNIGSRLSDRDSIPLHLAGILTERVKELQKDNPKISQNLWLVIQRWASPVVTKRILAMLSDGTADELTIRQALMRRRELQNYFGRELKDLRSQSGRNAGIAAVLLEDQEELLAVLQGKDDEAKRALLACARLIRMRMPLEEISALYRQKNDALRYAVDRYLEIEDAMTARKLIWSQHPNEAFILGFNYEFSSALVRWEDQLRTELRDGNADEILAGATEWSNGFIYNVVIRIKGNTATITRQQDSARYEYRALKSEELSELRGQIAEAQFDELPTEIFISLRQSARLDAQYYIHATKAGGMRLRASHDKASVPAIPSVEQLAKSFDRMSKEGEFKFRYPLAERLSGFAILHSASEPSLKNICIEGNALRVLVENRFEGSTTNQALLMTRGGGAETYSWHQFAAGTVGAKAAEPAACPFIANEVAWKVGIFGSSDTQGPSWQLKLGEDAIRAGYADSSLSLGDRSGPGLWRLRPNQTPEKIASGTYYRPLVTKDGKWIIVTKNETPEGKKLSEESIVRLDTKTYRELPTNLNQSREYLRAVVENYETGQVLVCQQRSSNSETERFGCSWLNPATGEAAAFKGEMRPLAQQTFRGLQKNKEGNKYWAAIPERDKKRTLFGLYDSKLLTFQILLEVPELIFDSMQMWVDESTRFVYVVYQGQLLRWALP